MCDFIYCAYTLISLCIVLYMSFMKQIKMIIIIIAICKFMQLKFTICMQIDLCARLCLIYTPNIAENWNTCTLYDDACPK